jgi:hypothetical protein
MSGNIIEFRRHHDLRRARLCSKQAVTHGPAAEAGLDQQISRISGLLEELQDLTRDASSAICTGQKESGEDDPQPDVDRRLLDRMYRALDLGDGSLPTTCATQLHGSGPS